MPSDAHDPEQLIAQVEHKADLKQRNLSYRLIEQFFAAFNLVVDHARHPTLTPPACQDTMYSMQIATIRRSLGLTRDEFAELCGVTRAAVSHWENGLRRPGGSALRLIAALGKKKKSRNRP